MAANPRYQKGTTNVPDNDRAKLMYYLSCISTVLDLSAETGIAKLTDYQNYSGLTQRDKTDLMALVLTLNNTELSGKCIFPVDNVGTSSPGIWFLDAEAMKAPFKVGGDMMVGGKRRNVTKVMLYEKDWMEMYYLEPWNRVHVFSGVLLHREAEQLIPRGTDVESLDSNKQDCKASRCCCNLCGESIAGIRGCCAWVTESCAGHFAACYCLSYWIFWCYCYPLCCGCIPEKMQRCCTKCC